MAFFKWLIFLCFVCFVSSNNILCEQGFCRKFLQETGCATPAIHCRANNATHTGITLPSPTICNCCEYCLPFIGEGDICSVGGPGLGTTVGRCGPGLTCSPSNGTNICTRLNSECHRAQDEFDAREKRGETGALEHRPHCDGKGKYASFYCIPAHTCFCQSEDGKRLFGEVPNFGASTKLNMHCECSRFNDRIKKTISPGVPIPIVGPRCTADGNFNPIQCIGKVCHCVDTITGVIRSGLNNINLDEKPISDLPCYNEDQDLYPQYSEGTKPPYNFTTPCLEDMDAKTKVLLESEEEGFNIDFFSSFPECYPDGSFGNTAITRNGTKICTDERGHRIEDFEAFPSTPEFNTMNCKCARTSLVMTTSTEKPICCKNGNFRKIQCRRGMCRCVDSDGRQIARESADVTTLSCYSPYWRTC